MANPASEISLANSNDNLLPLILEFLAPIIAKIGVFKNCVLPFVMMSGGKSGICSSDLG